ncbi:unnamed protein product, partial [Cuscuta epithymum]
MAGKHVMVVAHANSLRSIVMYLDELTSQEVINLELSTGVPMLYTYKDGKFVRRGSPPGSLEAGVYAHTEVYYIFVCIILLIKVPMAPSPSLPSGRGCRTAGGRDPCYSSGGSCRGDK